MKIKKNWSWFKEPQAPSTQSTVKLSDKELSEPSSDNLSLTNDQDNIEVLPRLNNNKSDSYKSDNDESDNDESDDYESDNGKSEDEGSVDEGSTDEELADKSLNFIKRKILKDKGVNIPLPS